MIRAKSEPCAVSVSQKEFGTKTKQSASRQRYPDCLSRHDIIQRFLESALQAICRPSREVPRDRTRHDRREPLYLTSPELEQHEVIMSRVLRRALLSSVACVERSASCAIDECGGGASLDTLFVLIGDTTSRRPVKGDPVSSRGMRRKHATCEVRDEKTRHSRTV